ncbi:MAG: 2,3-bisphosphoglycerate-independent phosphoglycerate mutase [Geminicoccaceae bacterium]
MRRRPVVLCILDGWGYRRESADNAVALADTPVFDRWFASAPHCFLTTHGKAVGLPEGQFGNSEVGHMNLGGGRVMLQELPRIDGAIEDGSLWATPPFVELMKHTRDGSGCLHLVGLVSPGGVHAHERHLFAIARAAAKAGLRLRVHAILDGRDTPPRSARASIDALEAVLGDLPDARIATVCGRYYAMDRDRRWERTRVAYEAMVAGRDAAAEGVGHAASAIDAVSESYAQDVGDEFVPATVIGDYAGMADGDGLLCFNFRADRVRQLLRALCLDDFDGFARVRRPALAAIAGMTSYAEDLAERMLVLFPPQSAEDLMGEVVARAGLKQLRMAESEKYPHVTFFFNGGEEHVYPGEERILVASPKVATYDLQPEMSAPELTDRCVAAIGEQRFDFILINFANPDMVGHTGVLEAAIRAVATVDRCLGRIIEAVLGVGGAMLVTADHGNCELMRDPVTGGPHTAHTTNPVPCFLVGAAPGTRLQDGRLGDVAPTLLTLLDIPKPEAMTGHSLIAERA